MKITKKKIKDPPNFCFCCGRTLEAEEYILNLGTPGSTFELCEHCLKQLSAKSAKALNAK